MRNIKPIRVRKPIPARHVQHAPMGVATLNGHSAPKTHHVEPTARHTQEQRKSREFMYQAKRLMNEFAMSIGIILDVDDLLARGVVAGTLYELQQRHPEAVASLRGVTLSDSAAELLEQRGHVADASYGLIRVCPKLLRELTFAQGRHAITHEVAHIYLRHSAQSRPAATKEVEADQLAYRWGF